MLAGLLVCMRSVHELDQAGILKLGSKKVSLLRPNFGACSATCRLVFTAAAFAAAAPPGLPHSLQDIGDVAGAQCSLCSHPAAAGMFAAAFIFCKADFFEIGLAFSSFFDDFHQFDDFIVFQDNLFDL